MFNKIITIIFMSVMGTVQGLALDQMLQVDYQKTRILFRISYWTMLGVLSAIANVVTNNQIPMLQFGIYGVGVLFPILYFYTDPIWRRILAFFLMVAGLTSAELVVLLFVEFTKLDVGLFYDRTNSIVVFCIGVGNFFAILIISIMVVVWKKLFHKGSKIKYFWFFLLYVFNYFVTLAFMEIEFRNLEVGTSEFWPVLTSIICEISLLAVIFSQSEKEEIEQCLNVEKKKSELEQIHYNEVKKRRRQIYEISYRNQQQLTEIKSFLKLKQSNNAEDELLKLLKKVEDTKEYPFCSIPIVNAILSEKQKECKDSQLLLETNLQISEEIKIKQMDLCCLFGNMIDNAIRACKQMNNLSTDINLIINLSAVIKGNYLIIKCTNPVNKAPIGIPEGTGYGLKIIKDIASRYYGDVHVEYNEQKYDISIVLQNM